MESFIQAEPNSGCWLWTGATTCRGYGTYRGRAAHRESYERYAGPIPEHHELHHLCGVESCVNPDHLSPLLTLDHRRISGNALKADCVRGHPLSGENLYVTPEGWRECRTCKRAALQAWKTANPERWSQLMANWRSRHKEKEMR